MNEEQIRRLLEMLLSTRGNPLTMNTVALPTLAANLAMTSEDFQASTLRDTLDTTSGQVNVVDASPRRPATPVNLLARLTGALGQAFPGAITTPGQQAQLGQVGFGEFIRSVHQPFTNLNVAAMQGIDKLAGLAGVGQPAIQAAAPSVAASTGAGGVNYPTTVSAAVPAAPVSLPSPSQVLRGQPTAAPTIPPTNIGIGSTINAALQTPAVIQALAALGQGIAGQGNPINVIGDAASQMAQGQMVQNALAGSTNRGLGPNSVAGLSPQNAAQVEDLRAQRTRLEQGERALDIQEREASAREVSALASLTKAQQEGLEGWQWNAVKQQVANEYYAQAKANILARNPALTSLVDIEAILGSPATGVDADKVFTNLTPEQREQALNQAAVFTSQIEQGAPFSAVVGGGVQAPPAAPGQGQEPRPATLQEAEALPVGTVFIGPDGNRYRRTAGGYAPI